MNYLISAYTDKGIVKEINQDSLSVKKIQTPIGNMVFAVLCDGMGGHSKGELASATVVKAFEEWVSDHLIKLCCKTFEDKVIVEQWESILNAQNELIMNYGTQQDIVLGTTATVMLLTEEKYYIMNIGDTRAYQANGKLTQITKDHSLVALEIQNGALTEEQAKVDPRRNILLQCIGVSKNIFPDIFIGNTEKDTVYILCTDGFRHKVSDDEIYESLKPSAVFDASTIQQNSSYLVQLNKTRKETDNISVITVRTY